MNKRKYFFTIPALVISLLSISSLSAKDRTVRDAMNHNTLNNPFSFFDDFAKSSFFSGMTSTSGVNLYEEGNQLIVEANLPGLEADEIEVTYDQGALWIKGNKQSKTNDKDRNYYHQSQNAFSYALDIPTYVDETVDPIAEYKNGVMKVRFEKVEKEAPKKIKVIQK